MQTLAPEEPATHHASHLRITAVFTLSALIQGELCIGNKQVAGRRLVYQPLIIASHPTGTTVA
jgi:hypothetical protein